jgi:phosphate transport system substrate-binding protein
MKPMLKVRMRFSGKDAQMRKLVVPAAAAGVILSACLASALDITGAGATFPFPAYARWASAYFDETGNRMNYQSIGSGGGIRQIKAKTVDFGASDAPLKGEELQKSGLVQFPAVMGGLVPAINVEGIEAGKLKLTGPILANIFLGKIARWNDPAIVALNPGMKLPDAGISPVYRSDGSGTTYVWTEYLSLVSEEWKAKIGVNTSVQWPVGVGGKGNEGVSASVKQLANSIGYVEYAYAKQNKLNYALIQNKAGNFVEPSEATFQAAAAEADWSAAPGFGISLNNQGAATAWPVVSATFILMHAKAEKPEQSKAALAFFDWAFRKGDKLASDLVYVPLPEPVKAKVRAGWSQIVDASGKPVF